MLMKVEPNGMMFTVYFLFNKAQPDPEDGPIKAYLRERSLTPKRQGSTDYQGTDCQVWQFGSCYLTPFIDDIRELQRRGAQQALLTMELERALEQEPSEPVRQAVAALPPEGLAQIKASLVERFRVDSSFGTDQEGYLVVTVGAERFQEEFLKLASGS